MSKKIKQKYGPTLEDVFNKQNELEKFCGSMTKDAPFHLLDIAVRYTRYIKQRGRFPLLVNCMLLECWEVLYDRDNWNKI